MALLQNITLNNQYPYRRSGATATNTETGKMLSQIGPSQGREFTRFFGLPKASALPTGYNPGILMPLKHSQVSAYRETAISVSSTGNSIMAKPMAGVAEFSFDATGQGSLWTSSTGVASFTFGTNNPIAIGILKGAGSSSFSFDANGNVGAIASMQGSSSFSFSGTLQPYATGQMAGVASFGSGAIDEFAILGRMEYDFAVHIHETNGQPGTRSPIGTRGTPVNNITDALTIARGLNLYDLVFLSDHTLQSGDDVSGYRLRSDDWRVITVETGAITTDATFEKLSVYGEMSGTWNVFVDCWVYDVTNFLGWVRGGSIERVELAEYIDPDPFSLGSSYFDNVVPMYAAINSVLVMNTGVRVSFTNSTDTTEILNMSVGNILNASLSGGGIVVDSSCSGGEIIVAGAGSITNNSLLTVDDKGLNNEDTPWGAIATDNNTSGTMGNKLNAASAGGVDLNAMADAVWGTAQATYLADSSEFLSKIVTNKRGIIKGESGWSIVVYDDDGTTPILSKALKDKDGSAISDLSSGVLAQEEESSV